MTPDQELWGVALWVERNHGENGWFFIAQQQDRLLALGDDAGARRWDEIGRRLEALRGEERIYH